MNVRARRRQRAHRAGSGAPASRRLLRPRFERDVEELRIVCGSGKILARRGMETCGCLLIFITTEEDVERLEAGLRDVSGKRDQVPMTAPSGCVIEIRLCSDSSYRRMPNAFFQTVTKLVDWQARSSCGTTHPRGPSPLEHAPPSRSRIAPDADLQIDTPLCVGISGCCCLIFFFQMTCWKLYR